jgi:Skp family chaperone for outer membrane proteins
MSLPRGYAYSKHTKRLHAQRNGDRTLPTIKEALRENSHLRDEIKQRVSERQKHRKKLDDKALASLRAWQKRQEQLERLTGY